MPLLPTLGYYRRIVGAYLIGGESHLTFWHETPEENLNAKPGELGEYYMLFAEKANYRGACDSAGIPQLDYRGKIGPQYNPIAIAQYALGNYNLFRRTGSADRCKNFLRAADWLVLHLEPNLQGLAVWNHHFDWEYRDTLRAPWYSALAQGQGISVLVRAHLLHSHQLGIDKSSGDSPYLHAAQRALASFFQPVTEGGVAFTDQRGDVWFEEYVVSPPTHILNGFMWAAWGVYDYFLMTRDHS
ncbi:MAG: D-glucuronyl C5-epimerase family protein, partial [Candidatus Sulfotelmatobacter sp.]